MSPGSELLEVLARSRLEEHLVERGVQGELVIGDRDAVDVDRALVARREIDAYLRLAEHELAGLGQELLDAGIDEARRGVAGLRLHEAGNDQDESRRDEGGDADSLPLHVTDLA